MSAAPIYAAAAPVYLAKGWAPLPLPPGKKGPPPPGFTGYRGRTPDAAQVQRWRNLQPAGNVALRAAHDFAGVDLDAYRGGLEGLAKLEALYGPLPATVASTSRTDGSGIRLYRVPARWRLRTNPAPGVDMIQAHHRYVVGAPSLHPEGRVYRWVDLASGEVLDLDDLPEPGDLPDLPWGWLEGLHVEGRGGAAEAATTEEVAAFIDEHAAELYPAGLVGWLRRLGHEVNGRHDHLVTMACWAMREAAAGWYPAAVAVNKLDRWWRTAMADDTARRDGGEFGSAVAWAIANAQADPERVAALRRRVDLKRQDHAADHLGQAEADHAGDRADHGNDAARLRLPAGFYEAHPRLAHVAQAADAALVARDAVLGAVLARVVASATHCLDVPGIVAEPCGASLLVALVGASNTGKTAAVKVARRLVPSPPLVDLADELPLGSGEGLAEVLFDLVDEPDENGKRRRVKRQTRFNALVVVDEGQVLMDIGRRTGSTTVPTLRTIFTHGTIGNTNAAQERRRVVAGERYVFGVVLGIQPDKAGDLLDDSGGGTPQRFVWLSSVAELPDQDIEHPGPLDWCPPGPEVLARYEADTRGGLRRFAAQVDPSVVAEVRADRRRSAQGDRDAPPEHHNLKRLKVALALGLLLDGRPDITSERWAMAGQVLDVSTKVLASMHSHVRHQAELKAAAADERYVQRSAKAEVAKVSATEGRALHTASRAIGNVVRRHAEQGAHAEQGGGCTRKCFTLATNANMRKSVSVDDAAEEAVRLEWITAHAERWIPGSARPA